jgi:RNA polymerase sigma-32 factor
MGSLGSVTALEAYRHSLAGVSPLKAEEERALAMRWRAGDARAGTKIIEASLPFVITVAAEYRRWGAPLEDLIQQCNLGLLKAAMRYEPARDCRLITYAVYWIRAEIREYVVRAYRVVRIGGSKAERRALRTYRRTREDDPAKLAALAGVSEAHAQRLLPILKHRDLSLDNAVDGESPAVERLRDEHDSPEEVCVAHDDGSHLKDRVSHALAALSTRERWILDHRVLSPDDEGETLEALGRRLGVSKERVRQLEARALQKLRGALGDLDGRAA